MLGTRRPPTPRTSRWTARLCCLLAALVPSMATLTTYADPAPSPITVEADQFSVYLADEKAVWRGNVTATQGNYTFRTSQLTVHLDDLVAGDASPSSGAAGASSRAEEDAIELSADRVTYDLDRNEIQGLGNSELRRGMEYIRADNIVYEVGNRIARAEPDAGGRVRVQFLSAPGQPLFPGVPLTAAAAAGG